MQTVLSPKLQEATQALIDNLLASEPFLNYEQARTRLNQNAESRSLLDRLSHAQASLRKNQADGGATQARLDMILRQLQRSVQNNPVITDYANAQQEAITLLREINSEIGELLGIDFAAAANHATCWRRL